MGAVDSANLAMLTKDLSLRWERTMDYWHDAKSLEFERKYIELLRDSVDKTIPVIEELDKLITKVRRDCE